MYRKSARILLAAVFVIAGGTTLAWAQVERSGNTFHRAVCPGPAAPGTARCHAHVVTDGNGNPFARDAQRNVTPSGYNPQYLWTAYSITPNLNSPFPSSTPIIAIVDAYGYNNAESDLNVYRNQWHLGSCTTANGCFTKYNQNGVKGSYPRQNTGWAQESALDLDMASAMCPSCRIILVEANSASYADLATAENTAAGIRGVHAISNSYGGGESGSTPYEPAYNHPGIAITVSTGDSGYGVAFPATSPHVTAVGGTSLNLNSSPKEVAWSGGGSGCSAVYDKPAWQTDALCTKRMEADVSAVADPNTGVAVYGPNGFFGSSWLVFGGTSVAAPLVAGIYGNNGGSVNYGQNPYPATIALHDITSGSNGNCGGTYFCTAGPGYDGPTGLGSPNGNSAF